MSSCSEVPFVMERNFNCCKAKLSAMIKNSCPVLARYTLIAPVVEKCLTIINEGVSLWDQENNFKLF